MSIIARRGVLALLHKQLRMAVNAMGDATRLNWLFKAVLAMPVTLPAQVFFHAGGAQHAIQ